MTRASDLRRLWAALGAAALCIACEPGNVVLPGPTTPSRVTSVTVNPAALTLVEGQQGALNAVVEGTGNPGRGTTWTSRDHSIATVDGDLGIVTAIKPGTTTIVAFSVANPDFIGSATVTVTAKPVITDPREYFGTYAVTAAQLLPLNSCFLNGYSGTLKLAAGSSSSGLTLGITYGIESRGYGGTIAADGSFTGSGAGPAGGSAVLTGKVTLSGSSATIAYDESFSCPASGTATFRGAGPRTGS